jgi:hypothetical protein
MLPKNSVTESFGLSMPEESGKQMGKEQLQYKNSHKIKKNNF